MAAALACPAQFCVWRKVEFTDRYIVGATWSGFYAIFTPSRLFYTAYLYDHAYILVTRILTRCRFVPGEDAMDILFIALMVGFVAVSMGLTYFLENLRRPK